MKRGSTRKLGRRSFLKGALATAPLLLGGPSLLKPARALAHRGLAPSTTTEPYLVPTLPGVCTIPILTTGDSIRGYRMVGIPDGLGAFNSDGHDFTLIMNHELLATNGIARGHGSKGAFVSRWKIDRRTLEVLKGEDFTACRLPSRSRQPAAQLRGEDVASTGRRSKVAASGPSTSAAPSVLRTVKPHTPRIMPPAAEPNAPIMPMKRSASP
jgi:hypothetical protein